jgi:hypothetical protein
MTDAIFDLQDDARIGFGDGTVKIPISAKPGALRHNPTSQTPLICRWHRSVQGPLTCTWTEFPSMLRDEHVARLPDLAEEDSFAYPTLPESRLQTISRWIAIGVLLASTAAGTFICFVTEHSDLL